MVESLPGVRACQVVGATRADKTVPYAFVLQPGARADAAGWTAACKAVMAGFRCPPARWMPSRPLKAPTR